MRSAHSGVSGRRIEETAGGQLQGNDSRPALIKGASFSGGGVARAECNKRSKLKRNVAVDAADRGQRNKVDEIAFGRTRAHERGWH